MPVRRIAMTGNGARCADSPRTRGGDAGAGRVPVSDLLRGGAYPEDVVRAAAPDWAMAAALAAWGRGAMMRFDFLPRRFTGCRRRCAVLWTPAAPPAIGRGRVRDAPSTCARGRGVRSVRANAAPALERDEQARFDAARIAAWRPRTWSSRRSQPCSKPIGACARCAALERGGRAARAHRKRGTARRVAEFDRAVAAGPQRRGRGARRARLGPRPRKPGREPNLGETQLVRMARVVRSAGTPLVSFTVDLGGTR